MVYLDDKFIPLSVPNLKGNELKYVTGAIESEWVSTGGSYITEFEKNIAGYVKTDEAVACQSGTAAIHLALISGGIGLGDCVIVPTLTFIATVNPVKYVNAVPIFMDCDDSLCIDPQKVEDFCEKQCYFENNILYKKKTDAPVKALIAVHIFGNMADMEKLSKICKKYNLLLIEDAAEALGTYFTEGTYKGKFAGTIGDIGIYSFNGNKIITTGGGGMVVGKKEYLQKIRHLSTQAKFDADNFTHDAIGYNYRMTNLQAALGIAQLEQLENFIEIKTENYNIYKKELENTCFEILDFKKEIRPNYWFYSLYNKKIQKDFIIEKLKEKNIQSRPIWGLIHMQKPYLGSQTFNIEKAFDYFDKIVNIPCSTNLTKEDALKVSGVIKNLI